VDGLYDYLYAVWRRVPADGLPWPCVVPFRMLAELLDMFELSRLILKVIDELIYNLLFYNLMSTQPEKE
jgi:hypothetical protein